MSPLGEKMEREIQVKEESLTGEEGGSFILFIRKDPSRPFCFGLPSLHCAHWTATSHLFNFLSTQVSNIALFSF